MNWFRDLKVFYKIMLILAVYVVAVVINTSISVTSMVKTQTFLTVLDEKIYDAVQLATENASLLKRADELLSQAVSFSDEDVKTYGVASTKQLISNLGKLNSLDTDSKVELQAIENNVNQYIDISLPLVDAMLSGNADFEALAGKIQKKADLFESTNKALAAYKAKIDDTFKQGIADAISSGEATLFTTSVVSASFFVTLALFIVYVASSISNTSNQVNASLKELAEGSGELGTRIEVSGRDELGRLAQNFNSFMDKLGGIVRSIMNVSNPLLEAANDLDSNTRKVRSVTTDLGSKAREAKQAVDEITQSITEISGAANEASSAMQATSDQATKGLQIVASTISNSKELNTQIINAAGLVEKLAADTKNVANILDVISTIAEQTNLLALNAAIEAARAGEQGRGFAVVADEVRALASKTGDATTEIRDVLGRLNTAATSTVKAMSSAKDQSEMNEKRSIETGGSLEEIKSQIEHVNSMNLSIAAATEEQTMVVANVSTIITAMYSSVESTEVSFNELAELASKLLQASDSLKGATSQFKL
ncbi:MAG: methyl-accepting chemotaxis protein [Hahellaceae bacterium]|nr:methyl-accepting chemotaxis protein [Hahellaceae bacterium]MCP5210914.1 methyl-accepting chemotaxis protein [Hahellaceae bacterium]